MLIVTISGCIRQEQHGDNDAYWRCIGTGSCFDLAWVQDQAYVRAWVQEGEVADQHKAQMKIRVVTQAMEELHGDLQMKVGDIEIDQHFLVQEKPSHPWSSWVSCIP